MNDQLTTTIEGLTRSAIVIAQQENVSPYLPRQFRIYTVVTSEETGKVVIEYPAINIFAFLDLSETHGFKSVAESGDLYQDAAQFLRTDWKRVAGQLISMVDYTRFDEWYASRVTAIAYI